MAMMSDLEREAEEAWKAVFADPAGRRQQAVLVAERAEAAGDRRARVVALRAVGWAARELGDHDAAQRALDSAIRLARRHRLANRLAEALVTRAGLHLELGHPKRALADLDDAAAAEGRVTIEMATQRAVVLDRLGRYSDAVRAYESAAPAARNATAIERCKYLNNMAGLLAEIGRHDEAIVALEEAGTLAAQLGPSAQAIVAHNHAAALLAAGRVSDALARYDEAEARFAEAGVPLIEHHLQRLEALLTLRLGDEAVEAATRVIGELGRSNAAFLRGDAHLNLARAHLMRNDTAPARAEAELAADIYRRQHRPAWVATAEVVAGHAALAGGAVDEHDRRAVVRAAALLRRRGVTAAAAEADLLAGRLALAAGRTRAAVAPLQRAADDRRSGPALQRIGGAVAAALLAEVAGDRPRAVRAARAGLTYLDDFRASTASIELGARVSGHGEELARIGLGAALAAGRPGRVHDWLEVWRGRALVASGTGTLDPELTDLLARLRHVLAERGQVLDDAGVLERQEASLELAIRSRARVTGRTGSGATKAVSLGAARQLLGTRTLVEYGVHGGDVFAIVATDAKATLHHLGPVGVVDDELGHLMSGVRRVAVQASRQRGVAATTTALRHALTSLDTTLVAPLGALGDGPLVIVPPAALLALPWGSLVGLRARTVTVSPSVTVWARAVAVERRGHGVVLVAGPRLPHAADEIAALAAVHPATAVVGAASTTAAVLDAFRHADLVHLACHGHLRSDNPMFSSLELADGPLTAYDIEAVDPFARRVVLAACSSGASAIHAGDELIGVLSTLLANGAASVVASSALVPDLSTKELMVELHRRLAAGDGMAAALSEARRAVDDNDPAMLVASLAFSCYGAG
jgi:tetratricopeptide (TPR) repeat protein